MEAPRADAERIAEAEIENLIEVLIPSTYVSTALQGVQFGSFDNTTPVNTEVVQNAARACTHTQRETPPAYCQGRFQRGGRDSNCCPPCAGQLITGIPRHAAGVPGPPLADHRLVNARSGSRLCCFRFYSERGGRDSNCCPPCAGQLITGIPRHAAGVPGPPLADHRLVNARSGSRLCCFRFYSERGGRDSNPQPPARQAGTLTN